MKLGVLFSGGKDSNLAAYYAVQEGHEIACLITIESENDDSYMFHTPSIGKTKAQASVMNLPLLSISTKGEKEDELNDLRLAIKRAIDEHKIKGIVTGAVESVYQSTRIQKICKDYGISCFNPLWQTSQLELLKTLVDLKFEVIIVGVSAYPLDKSFLGRRIDSSFISEVSDLENKYGISPSGEGGEFETFVLSSPLFESSLNVDSFMDSGSGNSWRRDLSVVS